jgi:DNA helicase-4
MKQTTLRLNWLGRLLTTNVAISFDAKRIFIISKNATKEISITDLYSIININRRPWGCSLVFHTSQDSFEISFLKPIQIIDFVEAIDKQIKVSIVSRILSAYDYFKKYCIQSFLRDSQVEALGDAVKPLSLAYSKHKDIWNEFLTTSQREYLTILCDHSPLAQSAKDLRNSYETAELLVRSNFLDKVESNPLTEEQRLAVIRNNDRNLVLAAAGTGKTSVMIAKALDLIVRGEAKPEEILLLAYNKSAANELLERFIKRGAELSIDVTSVPRITTFHALGLGILKASNIPFSLSRYAEDSVLLNTWVTKWTSDYISQNQTRLTDFITLFYTPINPFDFETTADYERHTRDNEFRTLNGELVRGYQELLIANYFFLNGVVYEYEPQYIKKRRVEIGFDYRPDFYFPKAGIYLEHFGISRDGSTRADIDSVEYNNSISSKRALHKEYQTTLIETYHYDWVEENLENRLKILLEANEIEMHPISSEDILKVLNEFDFITKAADRFLKALKAIRVERLSESDVETRIEEAKAPHPSINAKFLGDLHEAYKSELHTNGEIDFDDMIIRAISAVKSGQFSHKWKHILVDEFQDISASRWELIDELINIGPSPIMTAVGDDWQSIYRFSGGKLALITEFETSIGTFTKTTLQRTFRYNSSIAETAGTFIMENKSQYQKHIVTNQIAETPQVYLLDSSTQVDKESSKLTKRCLEVVEKIRHSDSKGSIAIIARYNYLLNDARSLISKTHKPNIYYWSFHRSKGLEADYCILIGLFRGKSGFPNENVEDAVVEALLPTLDNYKHSEERRLMYVGLTRARKKSYIIADPYAPSEFIDEMLAPKYNIHIASTLFKDAIRQIYKCPGCVDGHLRMLNGTYGDFYVCTSERACQIRPRVCEKCSSPVIDEASTSKCRNPHCGHEFKICRKCARPMKLRSGKYGQFYGCSGFGIKSDQCDHTEKLQ